MLTTCCYLSHSPSMGTKMDGDIISAFILRRCDQMKVISEPVFPSLSLLLPTAENAGYPLSYVSIPVS